MATTNYSFPEFTADGTVDLIGIYNDAMQKIDTALHSLSEQVTTNTSSITTLQNDAFSPAASDASLTVSNLNGAKVTSSGIIYFKSAS